MIHAYFFFSDGMRYNSTPNLYGEFILKISTYLTFNGNCAAAFDFYQQALGGEIVGKYAFAGSPMADQVPADWGDKIMHIDLQAQGQSLMGCDSAEEHGGFKGFNLMLAPDTVAEAEQLFAALSPNATIMMPLEKTFWAERFGMLVDQFGVTWAVNCELPQG
jgi:PhnB protein